MAAKGPSNGGGSASMKQLVHAERPADGARGASLGCGSRRHTGAADLGEGEATAADLEKGEAVATKQRDGGGAPRGRSAKASERGATAAARLMDWVAAAMVAAMTTRSWWRRSPDDGAAGNGFAGVTIEMGLRGGGGEKMCNKYGLCGVHGVCNIDEAVVCKCLKGFEPKSPEDWSSINWSGGCRRRTGLNCSNGVGDDGFVRFSSVKVPDTTFTWVNMSMGLGECHVKCLMNCSCMAYDNSDVRGSGSGCVLWFGDLVDIREFAAGGGQDLYVRMAASVIVEAQPDGSNKKKNRAAAAIVSISVITGVLLVASIIWCFIVRTRKRQRGEGDINQEEESTRDLELPLHNFVTVANATNNFSHDKVIGEGGFGPVYKGILQNGQEIAVKRLSKNSGQGLEEFKNEVILISKLQHRNLVRLLGCCIQRDEMMLIYEYMPNKSLDSFIFDTARSKLLSWEKRLDIIIGIAQGLLYLHRDSRLRIIHRDLKAANILLDGEMDPKISDFGLARTFGGDETQANTRRVIGTYGYMSPEYAADGLFSMKSDVFSFGVLVLEIVSGKRNKGFYLSGYDFNLLGHAWNLWNEDRADELVDEMFTDQDMSSRFAVLRCIHIGLLCVQQRPDDRPTMPTVVMMLGSATANLPQPKRPGFYYERSFMDEGQSSSEKFSYGNKLLLESAGAAAGARRVCRAASPQLEPPSAASLPPSSAQTAPLLAAGATLATTSLSLLAPRDARCPLFKEIVFDVPRVSLRTNLEDLLPQEVNKERERERERREREREERAQRGAREPRRGAAARVGLAAELQRRRRRNGAALRRRGRTAAAVATSQHRRHCAMARTGDSEAAWGSVGVDGSAREQHRRLAAARGCGGEDDDGATTRSGATGSAALRASGCVVVTRRWRNDDNDVAVVTSTKLDYAMSCSRMRREAERGRQKERERERRRQGAGSPGVEPAARKGARGGAPAAADERCGTCEGRGRTAAAVATSQHRRRSSGEPATRRLRGVVWLWTGRRRNNTSDSGSGAVVVVEKTMTARQRSGATGSATTAASGCVAVTRRRRRRGGRDFDETRLHDELLANETRGVGHGTYESDVGCANRGVSGRFKDELDCSRKLGYMSPEYALEGFFSTKSDIFSFGVVLLEIVSGKKNIGFGNSKEEHNLLGNKEGKAMEIMDIVLEESCIPSEVLKCIQVGLLCVQQLSKDRPSMSSVVSMLSSETISLPQPIIPGYFTETSIDILLRDEESNSENGVTVTLLGGR
ncbi:hypothetical protein Scep_013212 [Stephania cephalantha]|uniref:Uncharacterized protein n=1 Tax=Stephania cephalantha TaxID=152367 RepID=A0AAP0JH01_9MAGN